MPTKHHTYPHQPNGRREQKLALGGALQKDANYPIHTTPTGEVALNKLIRRFIKYLNRRTFQLRSVCYDKKNQHAKFDDQN